MYLLSAEQIAKSLAGLAAAGCSAPPQTQFNSLLDHVRTRLEEVLNVDSIRLRTSVEHFSITKSMADTEVILRLSNAFLSADKGIIIHSVVDGDLTIDHEVDRLHGLVFVTLPQGNYKVTYESGFAADEITGVFEGHPDWMQSIAIAILVQWVRLVSSSSIPKDVSYYALNSAMIREIATRTYERYMRPRANVVWPYRSARIIESSSVTLPAAEE